MLEAPEHISHFTQWIPRPSDEVFEFFTKETNLQKLTPPWLHFTVLSKSTPQIESGTLINYQLKLFGVPVKWQTRIEEWEPGERFVDNQLSGPYSMWHHTHSFVDENGGTRMQDTIRYRLPFGRLGDLAAAWKVHRQVNGIFTYRRQVIEMLFRV